MSKAPYFFERPTNWTSPVLFASPHSGAFYPPELIKTSVLDADRLRSSEDAHVQRLYFSAPEHGSILLSATYPRAWVDLNRDQTELDPALIEGISRSGLNPRIASGLGVIPRVVAGGRAIYRGKISQEEATTRLARVWRPYHQMLASLLAETRARFGQSILVDCHSMPREALGPSKTGKSVRPEVVIGDRYGASCSGAVVTRVEEAFVAEGFKVARNVPFAGAYILRAYGRPAQNAHAVQVEIDRSLYMDEATLQPHSDFAQMQKRLSRVVARIAAIDEAEKALAAE